MTKKALFFIILAMTVMAAQAKTLVAYYSFTNNIHTIVGEITKQIDADVFRIEPAEKGLDYAANNYAIGTQLLNAIKTNPNEVSSYPAIDPVTVDMSQYDVVIVATPLWWSQMAAPMQTFLFNYGKQMAGKKICMVVSSASSGISGVITDAKRLIPDGDFVEPNLWIRSSQVGNAASMIMTWLSDIDYDSLSATEPASDNKLNLTIGGRTLTATLVDNSSTAALKDLLAKGPITIDMSDYGNMEKVGPLPESLPRNDEDITTEPGDLILYLGRNFVIYYDTNHWDFTRLGKIDNISQSELKSILGTGNVSVTLSLPGSQSGITDITIDTAKGTDLVYDMLGRRVYGQPSAGIYVINGQKTYVR